MEQTIEYRGYKIEVKHDSDPEYPNDWWCDECFLVYQHRDFNIERDGFYPQNIHSYLEILNIIKNHSSLTIEQLEEYNDELSTYTDYNKDYFIFPVEAYIHSGVSLSLFKGHKQCRFDSSVTGFILVARNYADDNTEQAELYAEGLVETWNHYLSGNVYGFVTYENKPNYSIPKKLFDKCVEDNISILEFKDKLILSDDWNEIDSCWGYYGDPNISGLLEEAKSVIDNLINKNEYRDLLLQR